MMRSPARRGVVRSSHAVADVRGLVEARAAAATTDLQRAQQRRRAVRGAAYRAEAEREQQRGEHAGGHKLAEAGGVAGRLLELGGHVEAAAAGDLRAAACGIRARHTRAGTRARARTCERWSGNTCTTTFWPRSQCVPIEHVR